MTVVRAAVEVESPPEGVWEVIADPRNLPMWDRHIESVEDLPEGGLRVGTRYVTVLRLMRVHAHVTTEVIELDPPRLGVFHVSGLLEATITTRIEELARGRSLLQHEVDYKFPMGALGRLAARSLRIMGGAGFMLRHGTLAQKRQIEARRGAFPEDVA